MSQLKMNAGLRPEELTKAQVSAEFLALLKTGAKLLPAGEARAEPEVLTKARYRPHYKVRLFNAVYYLTHLKCDENIGFFVAYVGLDENAGQSPEPRVRKLYPRIFYKDPSLMWRVGSHFIRTDGENWIGKGAAKWQRIGDDEVLCSAEETTNLPFELQGSLDELSRWGGKAQKDHQAVALILRHAPNHRLSAYSDFLSPRAEAEQRLGLIRGGRQVASFRKATDPGSLYFAKGFEPDFDRGVLERSDSGSRLYGGFVHKYRIASTNGRIQYQFVNTPNHVWVNPPQSMDAEVMSYGVRNRDVEADELLFVPGFEYHYIDDDGSLHSQIPEGFVGEVNQHDPFRVDASPWIEKLPVVAEFRRKILGERRR